MNIKLQYGDIPLLVRRGGCAINKMARSHLSGADGVVAYEQYFGMRPRSHLSRVEYA